MSIKNPLVVKWKMKFCYQLATWSLSHERLFTFRFFITIINLKISNPILLSRSNRSIGDKLFVKEHHDSYRIIYQIRVSSHLRLSCIRRIFHSFGACNVCLEYRLISRTTLLDVSPMLA